MKARAIALALVLALASPTLAESRFGVRMDAPRPVPDLERLDPELQAEHRTRLERLAAALANEEATRDELGEAWGALGMWYHALRYRDRARRAYRIAAALQPDDGRWIYYLAHIYQRDGDFNASVRAFRRAIELRPQDVAARIWLAEIEYKSNQPQRAAALAEEVLAIDPGQPRALLLRARVAVDRMEFARAVELLERAEARDARGADVQYLLSTAHQRLGHFEESARHLEAWEAARATRVETELDDPLMARVLQLGESTKTREQRALVELAKGRSAEAIRLQRAAVEADPENMMARINLGVTLFQSGDAAAAIEVLQEVLRIHPASPPHPELAIAHFDLCAILDVGGRLREAEAQCRSSLVSDPEQRKANLVLARILLRTGRPGEAIAHFERAIARDPSDALARHQRALARVYAGQVPRAIATLEADLVVLPGEPLLQVSLARLLAAWPDDEVRNGARALALARAAHRSAPSVATAETLAMALAENGDYGAAATWQRSARDAVGAVRTSVDPYWLGERLALYARGQPCREPWERREAVTRSIPLQ